MGWAGLGEGSGSPLAELGRCEALHCVSKGMWVSEPASCSHHRLEKTFRMIKFNCQGHHETMSLSATSTVILNISRAGDSTTSLGSLVLTLLCF